MPAEIVFALPGEIRRIPASDFQNLPKGQILPLLDFVVGGIRKPHRDIIVTAAGTAQSVGQAVDLFRTGEGSLGNVWNTTGTFTKTSYHTTMESGGQFPHGLGAVIIGMEIAGEVYPAKAATVGSGSTIGQVTDSADHASQPTGYNPVAFHRAMMYQNRWEFHKRSKEWEREGLFAELPQRNGFSGFAGAATSTLVQNAAIRPGDTLLDSPIWINTEQDFFVRCIALSALAQPVDFVSWFVLDCLEVPVENP